MARHPERRFGPLAYFLKNRTYIGEVHHGGKWFKGEQPAIVDKQLFDQVQDQLKHNVVKRRTKFSESGAMLMGKLFDDKGNRMGPSFSSKRGVRYRFYVSTALRGRKQNAGSVTRVSAPEIEALVAKVASERFNATNDNIGAKLARVVVAADKVCVTPTNAGKKQKQIEIPWSRMPKETHIQPELVHPQTDQRLLRSIIRAHSWLSDLSNGRHKTIDSLAAAVELHPKVIRQELRLAFLSPDLTTSALNDLSPLTLKQIPKSLPLPWRDHDRLI